MRYRGATRSTSYAVRDTVGRIGQRTTIAATRNVSSLFASSLPFFGIGVGVAVTGYELKDSCDNLKDLRELEVALDPTAEETENERRVCGIVPPTKEEVWAKVRSAPGEAWDRAKEYVPDLPEVDFGRFWGTFMSKFDWWREE